VIANAGIDFKIVQPHKGFNRRIGEFSKHRISPTGEILTEEQWGAGHGNWLPNDSDMQFISSLMVPCHAPGKYASWIAPPRVGINNQPEAFEYVKIA
jgi:benzoyl-CoA 2,3-dioxygenase component B